MPEDWKRKFRSRGAILRGGRRRGFLSAGFDLRCMCRRREVAMQVARTGRVMPRRLLGILGGEGRCPLRKGGSLLFRRSIISHKSITKRNKQKETRTLATNNERQADDGMRTMTESLPHPNNSSAHSSDNTISSAAANTRLGSSTAYYSKNREISFVVDGDGTSRVCSRKVIDEDCCKVSWTCEF